MWLLHCTWLSELADGFESRVWRRALPPLCLLPVQKSQSSIRSAVCPHFFLFLLSFCFLVPFGLCRKQEAGDPVSLMPASDRGHRQLEH